MHIDCGAVPRICPHGAVPKCIGYSMTDPKFRHGIGTIPLAALALVVVLTVTCTIGAQNAPPWEHWTIVHVDPSMVSEFLAVQREWMAVEKKAGTPWRTVSRTEVFGDIYQFLITTPVESLASFDEKSRLEPQLATLRSRLQKYVTSQQSYAVRTLRENSNPLPQNRQPDLMVVNVARIAPGREQDYLNVMTSDFLPHFDKANIHHATGALTFGGESGFVHVFYIRNFAELDQGSPVVRALGAKGTQDVTAKFSGIVTRSDLWIVRLLPEVSYGLSPGSSNQRTQKN